ncbi:MAG: hypothetical protein OER43_14675 [Gammaproteobacteria bacterium]|nr:hypothetical protein [Gammaproteobacteria bacterium]MDH3413180.1 hypothetical protein [Gammaproteobacteria bacterium]
MDDPRDRFRIVLRPSRILALTLGCGYAGATACLLALDFGAGAKSLMISFLLFSAFCDLRFYAGLDERRRIREIIFHSNDDWFAISGAGRVFRGRPGSGRLVHPLAVSLSLKQADGKKLPVLILCDMCDIDAFRDLRVWLRDHQSGGGDPAGHRFSVLGFSAPGRSALGSRLRNGSRS